MATLTLDDMRTRYDALIELARVRDVSLDHVEIRDPFMWVEFVEDLLGIDSGVPVPSR